jgi:hypothetical protein
MDGIDDEQTLLQGQVWIKFKSIPKGVTNLPYEVKRAIESDFEYYGYSNTEYRKSVDLTEGSWWDYYINFQNLTYQELEELLLKLPEQVAESLEEQEIEGYGELGFNTYGNYIDVELSSDNESEEEDYEYAKGGGVSKFPIAIERRINEINKLLPKVKEADEIAGGYFGSTHYTYVQLEKPIEIKGKYVYIHSANGKYDMTFEKRYNVNKLGDEIDGRKSLNYDLSNILKAFKSVLKDNYAKGGSISIEKLRKVKNWYMETYPTDDLGEEINRKLTFNSLWSEMNAGEDFYDIVGVHDSIVRERIFAKLAEVLKVNYDVVYNKWLLNDNYAKGGAVKDKIKVRGFAPITKEEAMLLNEDFEENFNSNIERFTKHLNKVHNSKLRVIDTQSVIDFANQKPTTEELNNMTAFNLMDAMKYDKKNYESYKKALLKLYPDSKGFAEGGGVDEKFFHESRLLDYGFSKDIDLAGNRIYEKGLYKIVINPKDKTYTAILNGRPETHKIYDKKFALGRFIDLEFGTKYAKGGGVSYNKTWEVIGINLNGKMFKERITLGRMSDKEDVKNALRRRTDLNIREVTSIKEVFADGGGVDNPSRQQMLDYLNMYFDYYSELRTIAIEEDNILTRRMLKSLDDEELEIAYEDAQYEIKADTQYADGGEVDEVISINIQGYPYYLKKMGDTTHFKMANSKDGIDMVIGSHIAQHKGEEYYSDVASWLKGGKSPNGKSYSSYYYAEGGGISGLDDLIRG